MLKTRFEKLIIILCVIGLVVVVILALLAKPQNSFTEIYFNEHTELPNILDYSTPFITSQEGPFLIVPNVSAGWEKLGKEVDKMVTSEPLNFADLNKSYNISFTVISHEAKKTEYIWNVTSSVLNKTGEFELKPKENIIINLTILPTKAEWKLNNTRSEHWHDILDITDDSWLAGGGGEGRDSGTIVNAENLKDMPLAHDISWFGWVLQTKLSFEEIAREPYKKRYEHTKIEDAEKLYEITDMTLSISGGNLVADINQTKIKYISKIQKFEVNLTKNPNMLDEGSQEIHFWYQIRQIGNE